MNYYNCIIKINGQILATREDLTNWSDIETDYKRSAMGGVVRSFSSKFVFAGATCDALFSAFRATGLQTKGELYLYLLTGTSLEWQEYFSCELDFSSATYNGSTFELSCFDNGIAAKLTSNKSTKYEYDVTGLTTEQVNFDRIRMNNWGKSVITPITEDDGLGGTNTLLKWDSGWTTIPLYIESSSVPVKGAVEIKDQSEQHTWDKSSTYFNKPTDKNEDGKRWEYFAIAKKDIKVNLNIEFVMPASYTIALDNYDCDSEFKVGLFVFNSNGYARTIKLTNMVRRPSLGQSKQGEVSFTYSGVVSLSKGESISLMCRAPYDNSYVGGSSIVTTSLFAVTGAIYNDGGNYTSKISWQDIGAPVSFAGARPLRLLQTLLDSMCGFGEVTGAIEMVGNPRLQNCILCPAESIRNLDGAKLYTTFSEFCSFMETLFGYIYTIDGDVVTFKHRDNVFSNEFTKVVDSCTDFSLSVDNSMLYSQIQIGNEKVDYDEENGLLEYNFMQTFETGLTFGNNVLVLAPEYRVDCYGIEYLAEKREEETKDNDSDNDVFAIMLNSSNKPDTSIHVSYNEGGAHVVVDGMFNAQYHPRYCIEANKQYLATFTDKLKYASSDGNSSVLFNYAPVAGDILLPLKKYAPYNVQFKCASVALPSNQNGAVRVSHNGIEYNGWIDSLKLYPTKERSATYRILLADSSYQFVDPTPETDKIAISLFLQQIAHAGITTTYLTAIAHETLLHDIEISAAIANEQGEQNAITLHIASGEASAREGIAGVYTTIVRAAVNQRDDDPTEYELMY